MPPKLKSSVANLPVNIAEYKITLTPRKRVKRKLQARYQPRDPVTGQFVRADQHLNVGLSSYQPDSSVYGDSRGAGILEGQDYDSASCQDSLLTYPSHSAGIARPMYISTEEMAASYPLETQPVRPCDRCTHQLESHNLDHPIDSQYRNRWYGDHNLAERARAMPEHPELQYADGGQSNDESYLTSLSTLTLLPMASVLFIIAVMGYCMIQKTSHHYGYKDYGSWL